MWQAWEAGAPLKALGITRLIRASLLVRVDQELSRTAEDDTVKMLQILIEL